MIYPRLLTSAGDTIRRMQYDLDTVHLIGGQLDEVAILFKNEREMEGFVNYALRFGFENKVSVPRDRFHELAPQDFGKDFDVRFEFLTKPDVPWRIELMCIVDGMAPLHDRLRNHELVHVSFKCSDLEHYLHMTRVMGHVFPPHMEYENAYGRFGYFGAFTPYYKPRVNLRDARVAS